MTQQPMSVPPVAPRRAGPSLAMSLVIGFFGLALVITSAVIVTIPLISTFTSTEYSVPGDLRIHLHHSRYTVYQRRGTSSGFGGVDADPSVIRIQPSQVTVTAPDGTGVPVSLRSTDEKITRGSTVYQSSLEFDAPVNGEYDIRFTNSGSAQVIIVRSIADAIGGVAIWIGAGALGGLLLVLGIVMLIVGATRRGRQRRASYMGWADPSGAGYYGAQPQQWGTPGVTSSYPPQYPSAQYPQQYPPASYPPPPPTSYPPQPPPAPPSPPSGYSPPAEPPPATPDQPPNS